MTNSSASKTTSPWPDFDAAQGDGRRNRSDRSRRKIVEALFELMRAGDMNPTAVTVAARAGVGLRTVFRHFEDMESIFEEMTEELRALVRPKLSAPLVGETWKEQLIELSDRNGDLYEFVFPMQVALVLRRFQSDFLQKQYNREVNLIRTSLKSLLPAEVCENRSLFAAIEVTLTFATWRRLREDQNLSVSASKDTIKLMLNAFIAMSETD